MAAPNSGFTYHSSSEEEDYPPRRGPTSSNANAAGDSVDSDSPPQAGSKRKAPKKKGASGAPAPKKKSKRSTSSDSGSSDSDRDNLNQLTEKEREYEIFKQIEHQEMLKTRKEIQQRLMGNDASASNAAILPGKPDSSSNSKRSSKAAPPKPSRESGEESDDSDTEDAKAKKASADTVRAVIEEDSDSDVGEEDFDSGFHNPSDVARKMEKRQAMAELVKSRKEKKQNEEKRRNAAVLDVDAVFGRPSDDEGDDDDDDDKNSASDDSVSSSSDTDSESANEEEGEFDGPEIDSADYLNTVLLTRRFLARFVHAPFFEKTVVGCFVRLNIGTSKNKTVYRAVQVIGVEETAKIYRVENEVTNKGLRIKHGQDERTYRLEYVSNGDITRSEYLIWRDCMMKAKLPIPTIPYIEKKKQDIIDARNYHFTDEDIQKMIAEKKRFTDPSNNLVTKKAELLKTKIEAEQAGDAQRLAEAEQQIARIDHEIKIQNRNRHGEDVTKLINDRNQQAMRLAMKNRRRSDVDNEDDPFTRKSGRSRVVSGRKKGPNGEILIDDHSLASDASTPPKTSPTKSAAASVKKPALFKSLAPLSSLVKSSSTGILNALPKLSTPTTLAQATSSASTPQSGGKKLTLAEWRARKANGGAAGK